MESSDNHKIVFPLTLRWLSVRGQLIGTAITLAVMGITAHVFMDWRAGESERRDAACKAAHQHVESLEVRARAMAAGLSVEAYAEAENADVGKLVRALDSANNVAEVEAVIDAHAAELKAQDAAADAQLKTREASYSSNRNSSNSA